MAAASVPGGLRKMADMAKMPGGKDNASQK
jgi:hypothetical protein